MKRIRRSWTVGLFLVVVAVGPSAAARNVGVDSGVTVKVQSASNWTVDLDEQLADWRVGGIWAPTPQGENEALGEYRAGEARDAVQSLLASHRVTVETSWYESSPKETLSVRLLIDIAAGESLLIPNDQFAGGAVDLAVLLAWHGLALCDRTTAEDNEHADTICAAEREARRYSRGIHDGGFADHDRERLALIDIGRLGVGQGKRVYTAQSGKSAKGGEWWTSSGGTKAIRHDPSRTIRDYGASMGLPRDSSSRGH